MSTGPLVLALGGNAILRRGDDGSIATQVRRSDEAMRHVAALAARSGGIVLTHGNGPVVGNIVLRGEAARERIAPMPLWIADADSSGGIGVMLQMSLRNELAAAGVDREVVTVITQVLVSRDDPAFGDPDKPIGPYLDDAACERMRVAEPDWVFRFFPACGWRRVVASPAPIEALEAPAIAGLAAGGTVVIAAGGGGVPVVRGDDGRLAGVDAVIDKDRASARLAGQIGASGLVILMEADAVRTGWGTADERPLGEIGARQARALLAAGGFECGTIAPKLEAAADFAQAAGAPAHICRVEDLDAALAGEAGTIVVPD